MPDRTNTTHQPQTPRAKVLSREALLARRSEARAHGASVVHCHGCFDIVHPGHVRHLQDAKRQGDSQMFRYDAIAAGERFVGVIISETEAALQTLQELLELQFFLLGGSHSSGYGRVDISQISLIPDWHEFEPAASAKSGIRLTLLSDAILRDPGSAQTTSSLKQALDLARDPDREFVGTVLIGGFNRKWGLHLPQEWALQAGSVFCFPAGAIPDKRLETMVHEGVGERRLDGFGRVAVNWHGTDQYRETELPQIIPKSSPTLSGIGKKLAGTMAQRLLRQRLEQQLTDVVINYEGAFRSLPSRSQLSRVRVAARHALQSLDLTRITLHLSSLKGAKFDWLNSRVRNRISNSYEPLYEWVQRHANPASGDFLTVFSLTAGLPDLAGISGEITPELEAEYRARLIDGVMKLALEELKRKEGSDEG